MTTLDAITLVTAIVGAVTGTGALVWGISQYWLVGPRVSVSISEARIGPGGAITGGSAWAMQDPRYSTLAVAINVVNKGRYPATVAAVSVAVAKKVAYRDLEGMGISPPTQHRLEGNTSATWYTDFEAARALVEASREALGMSDRRLWGQVELATGRTVKSAKAISVP